jgi:hypothetical protein
MKRKSYTTLSERAKRTLAAQGFMSINGIKLAQHGKELPRSAPRLERSINDWTRGWKPWWFWQLHCSHERMWFTTCQQCKRIGVTQEMRNRRFELLYAELTHAPQAATPREAVEIFIAKLLRS